MKNVYMILEMRRQAKLWTTGTVGLLTADCTGATNKVKGAVGVETIGLTGNVEIVWGLTTDPTTLLTGEIYLIGTDAIGWVITTVGIVLAEIVFYIILGWTGIVELPEIVLYISLGLINPADPDTNCIIYRLLWNNILISFSRYRCYYSWNW